MRFFIELDIDTPTRYDAAKFIDFVENGYDILTSYFIDKIHALEPFGIFEVYEEEGRPDLISYKIYGKTQYWWILMELNNFIHPADIHVGDKFKYPSVEDLEDLMFSLKSLEAAQEE